MKATSDSQVGRGGGGAKEISPGKVSALAPAARPTHTVPLQVTAHRAEAEVDGPGLPVVAGAAGGVLPDPGEPATHQVPHAPSALYLSVLLLSLSDRTLDGGGFALLSRPPLHPCTINLSHLSRTYVVKQEVVRPGPASHVFGAGVYACVGLAACSLLLSRFLSLFSLHNIYVRI